MENEPPYWVVRGRVIVIARKADTIDTRDRHGESIRTRETDPKMIREAGLTTRSGSWYSPIPLDTGSLARSNNVSVHVHEPAHTSPNERAYVWSACCRSTRDIFHFRQRGQTTWACKYITRARTVYVRCTHYCSSSRYPRVARTPARRTLHLSRIIGIFRWPRPNANFVFIRSLFKTSRNSIRSTLYVSDILLLYIINCSQFSWIGS